MATLRKACGNCTSSKRKCVIQLPRCARCAQRGLECRYDLEPLNVSAESPEKLPNFSWDPSSCDTPGFCVMKPLELGDNPLVCRPGRRDTLELVLAGYLSVLNLVGSGKPAMFVHPGLQLQNDYNHIAALGRIGKGGVSRERLHQLLQIDVNTVPIKEALTALQSLLVCLAIILPSLDEADQSYAKGCLDVLAKWTQAILASARARKPQKLSPWQEWLFGESVRRTIIMAYALTLAVSGFNWGYCPGWLFVESLPFDGRPGLWMAESPQAWIAAAGARTGREVGEQLCSFHEFATGLDGADPGFRGDSFFVLLMSSHNGHGGKTRT